jgi:predicted GNAT family acetyltransferase
MDSPVIDRSPDNHAFTLSVSGEQVGYLSYTDSEGRRSLEHTVVEKAHEGNGYGTRLIERAVADTIAEGLRIVPECPMVAHWFTKHPELAEHLDAA